MTIYYKKKLFLLYNKIKLNKNIALYKLKKNISKQVYYYC